MIKSDKSPIVLTGPKHVGKFSFVKEILDENCHPNDLLYTEPGIDGIRQAVEFVETSPINDDWRVIVIDDASSLGEPAQDAILKIAEEPQSHTKLVLVVEDIGRLQPALRSRARYVIKCSALSTDEMKEFAESFSSVIYDSLFILSAGCPGYYKVLLETPGLEDLYDSTVKFSSGDSKLFFRPVPEVVKSLKGLGPVRDTVVHVLYLASRKLDRNVSKHVLRFCETLVKTPSATPEIHWIRMCAGISGVLS